MFDTLSQSPEKPQFSRTAIKRIRNDNDASWEYAVLSIFPEEYNRFKDENLSKTPSFIVYFRPQSPCVSHATDILYKSLRDSGQ